MKTKTKPTTKKRKTARVVCGQRITTTTRKNLGREISHYLDLMHDPRFKEEVFSQIVSKDVRSTTIYASNEEISISFIIDWKGGKA